jgi:LacI family sucrose operon transcriptional repressor
VIDRSEIRMVVEWFKAHKEVDAVLCVHDRLAAIVVAACREMKKVIPRDIAIGGGGLSGERFGFRKGWLTSIDVRFAELGKRACDLIFRQRQGETIPPATMLLVDGALCLGESTTGLL